MNIFRKFLVDNDFIRVKSAPPLYINLMSKDLGEMLGGQSQANNHTLIKDFETIPDLFIITNFLAKRVSKIPVKVVKASGRDAPNSELWKLVESPNFYQSWKDYIKTDYAYYNILGNSFSFGMKAVGFGDMITSIYNMPADKLTVMLAQNKEVPAWQNDIQGYQLELGGAKYNFKASEVLHNKYFTLRYNSGAWAYGISKYIPGDKINVELKAIYDAKANIIDKRGALGLLTNDSDLPDVDQTRMVQERLMNHGLKSDQQKVIVTTQKLRWEQMSLNIPELQLIENGKYSFERLCQLSEIDPVIFSADGSTFANKEAAIKDLYKNVIKGDVDELYENINGFISAGYGGDMIVPDWDKVQELESDKKVFTDMLTKQIEYSIITPYRAAEILYGDTYMDDGNPPPDEYFIKGLKKLNEPEPTKEILTSEMIEKLNPKDNG